jgi:adenylylsulfate kinase
MVVWLTGLSGAGKSTIATALVQLAKPTIPSLVSIDGDVVRDLFGAGLGFDEESRKAQIQRIQRLSLFLASQDIPVITSALYCHPDLMRWNRENLPGYFEVYVDTPLATVMERDTKGLYAKARAGETRHVVGIDVPWHAPQAPDLIVRTAETTPQTLAAEILAAAFGRRSSTISNGE